MNPLLELQQKRAKVIADIGAIVEGYGKEGREMNAEETEKYEKLYADEKRFRVSIEAIGQHDQMRKSLEESKEDREKKPDISLTRDDAFRAYLCRGMDALSAEERAAIGTEVRNQVKGTTTLGGYTVPTLFEADLEKAMLPFMGIVEAGATIKNTPTGADLQLPSVNDTGNEGVLVAEAGTRNTVDTTFGQITLGAYMFSSEFIKISIELAQDTPLDAEAEIKGLLAERLGRTLNRYATIGTGSAQPQGIVPGCAVGVTTTTGQTTSITANNLLDLQYSVNKMYRDAPKAGYMMSENTWKAVLKLNDTTGRSLVMPYGTAGIGVLAQNQVHGKIVTINYHMVDMTAAAKTVVYGDFSKHIIRKALGITVRRADELFMANGLIGFLAFMRFDSKLRDAGTNPVKCLQQAAS